MIKYRVICALLKKYAVDIEKKSPNQDRETWVEVNAKACG